MFILKLQRSVLPINVTSIQEIPDQYLLNLNLYTVNADYFEQIIVQQIVVVFVVVYCKCTVQKV